MSILDDPAPAFTTQDRYYFARWARPIAPIVFGVDDDTLTLLKSAIGQTIAITGSKMAETDPELGANFMWFFCRDWEELRAIPKLDKLFPDFEGLLAGLQQGTGNRHRSFAFDDTGGIRMVIVLLKLDATLADVPVQTLGVTETFSALLTWSADAFASESPTAVIQSNNVCIVKPEWAALTRAAYSGELPNAANDASHALRVAARARLLIEALEAPLQ